MKKVTFTEIKVGLLALLAILIIIYATLRVSERGLTAGGTYSVYAIFDSAEGLTPKTPIEIAGIQVGVLGDTELVDNRRARVGLEIQKGVDLTRDVVAQVRTKGFLGETYIDLEQGDPLTGFLEDGDTIIGTNPYGDLSDFANKLNAIADDVSDMTSPARETIDNFREFSQDLREFSTQNNRDWDRIVENLAQITENLNALIQENRGNVDSTFEHVDNIARKIDEGQGTIGKLVNDERTIDNLNEAVENLNQSLGGFSRSRLTLGYHLEYLGTNEDFKNYVEMALQMRPDKAFLFEFVADQDPNPDREIITSDVTTAGGTTSVTTERRVVKRDEFLFSVMFAQYIRNLRLRAGLIESTGGLGFDWNLGLFTASFSAFDFRTGDDEKPHLKAWGKFNVTPNIYLLGGIDDPLNPLIETDWFVGAGFQFVDNDVKSLLGLGASAAR